MRSIWVVSYYKPKEGNHKFQYFGIWKVSFRLLCIYASEKSSLALLWKKYLWLFESKRKESFVEEEVWLNFWYEFQVTLSLDFHKSLVWLCLKNSKKCTQSDTKASKSLGPLNEAALIKVTVFSGLPKIVNVFRNSYLSALIKIKLERLCHWTEDLWLKTNEHIFA